MDRVVVERREHASDLRSLRRTAARSSSIDLRRVGRVVARERAQRDVARRCARRRATRGPTPCCARCRAGRRRRAPCASAPAPAARTDRVPRPTTRRELAAHAGAMPSTVSPMIGIQRVAVAHEPVEVAGVQRARDPQRHAAGLHAAWARSRCRGTRASARRSAAGVSRHNTLHAASESVSSCPRCSKSRPSASYSSRCQPVPTPRSSATAGELVERRDLLGEQRGGAQRRDENAGREPHARGDRRDRASARSSGSSHGASGGTGNLPHT